MKETKLPEHRADTAHLPHQPLNRLVPARRVLRHELPALLRQINQDRSRFKQRQRLATRPVRVERGRNLVVRIERQEFRRSLVVPAEIDQVRLIRKLGLFQHDRRLHAVGCGQRVKLDAVRVLGGPFLGDGEGGEIGHVREFPATPTSPPEPGKYPKVVSRPQHQSATDTYGK